MSSNGITERLNDMADEIEHGVPASPQELRAIASRVARVLDAKTRELKHAWSMINELERTGAPIP